MTHGLLEDWHRRKTWKKRGYAIRSPGIPIVEYPPSEYQKLRISTETLESRIGPRYTRRSPSEIRAQVELKVCSLANSKSDLHGSWVRGSARDWTELYLRSHPRILCFTFVHSLSEIPVQNSRILSTSLHESSPCLGTEIKGHNRDRLTADRRIPAGLNFPTGFGSDTGRESLATRRAELLGGPPQGELEVGLCKVVRRAWVQGNKAESNCDYRTCCDYRNSAFGEQNEKYKHSYTPP